MANILITGGAQRVGKKLADYFGRLSTNSTPCTSKHTIIIHYNASENEARSVCNDIIKNGGKAVRIAADLSDAEGAGRLIERASSLMDQPIDVLINNASVFEFDTAEKIDKKIAKMAMAVNYTAPVILSQAMIEQVSGSALNDRAMPVIINILDQKLWNLNPDFYSYTASKAALLSATQMMFEAFESKARVCAIAPGIMLPSFGQTEEEFDGTARQNLLERHIDIVDLAKACEFIIDTKTVHGQIFHIDNGQRFVSSKRDVMFQS